MNLATKITLTYFLIKQWKEEKCFVVVSWFSVQDDAVFIRKYDLEKLIVKS